MTRSAALLLALAALGLGCGKELVCPQGELACGKRCVAVQIDPDHCGACDTACGARQECDAGTCACGPGTTKLADGCFDLKSAPTHCGAAEVACTGGQVCATAAGATACAASCPGNLQACDGGCVDLQADHWNCGACGHACGRGEACQAGACAPDLLYVACFATDDVRPVDGALRPGLPQPAGDGPIALAFTGDRLWVAASISHSLVSLTPSLGGAAEHLLGGNDLEAIAARDGLVYTSDVGSSSLVVFDAAAGRVKDEVVLGPDDGINPRAIALAGDRVFVALYGTDAHSGGQEIVAVDGAGTAAGGAVAKRVSVAALADAPGLAFPGHLAVVGTKLYATLANLKLDEQGQYYTAPAGHSKLAVIDTVALQGSGDPQAALTSVDLGADCTNAGSLTARGTTLWIACGGTGKLLPVDVSGPTPVVGAALTSKFFSPGNIAFCDGMGYVTDQWSGNVERFDPAGVAASTQAELCPTSAQGWAWAADLACAR